MKTQESQGCIMRMADDHTPDGVAESVTTVKTELRKTIQLRREAKGLESVDLHDQEEKKTIELSAEEMEKIRTRRERNRLSAQKCRKRRREHLVCLSQEANNIEEANAMLETEIEYLKIEKEKLSRMLRGHCCNITRSSVHNYRDGVVQLVID